MRSLHGAAWSGASTAIRYLSIAGKETRCNESLTDVVTSPWRATSTDRQELATTYSISDEYLDESRSTSAPRAVERCPRLPKSRPSLSVVPTHWPPCLEWHLAPSSGPGLVHRMIDLTTWYTSDDI